jgi:hypothetical protein
MSTIGATAPSQNTINYDALMSTTLMAYRPTLIDNIFKATSFLAALKQYGGIEYQDGGVQIQMELMYEKNDTFKSYSGYETLTVKPQDGITAAFFPWREIGGTITISRLEERQNSGEARILNLLEKKIMQAEMSIKATVNEQLLQGNVNTATFVPGNGAKDMFPLGYFLPSDNTAAPVAGGDVGNIARETYSWWRPHTATFGAAAGTGNSFGLTVTTYAGLKVALNRMYNYCSRGADGSAPNLVVTNQETFETYENALDTQKTYRDESLVSMGFDNVKLKGASMIWDELVPDIYTGTKALTTGTAFFLNTKFYKLVIDKQTDFITTPFVEPENQTAKTAKVLFMGNATINNARKLGVASRISLSIVS